LTIDLKTASGVSAVPARSALVDERTLERVLLGCFYLLLVVIAVGEGGPPDLGIMLAP